jgi:hypothetical protein
VAPALAEADGLQRLGRSFAAFLRLDAEGDQGRLDVLVGGQGRDEVEALEDEADALAAYAGEPRIRAA